MEVSGLTTTQTEQKELEKIDGILPTLFKEDLLTNIDCRLILSFIDLMEKRGAVYTVIMSKTKKEAAVLSEIFRKLTATIHTKENSKSKDEHNHSVLPSRNPFMNDTIVKHLLGFLPLKDMKSSRLVCRKWNSTTEICLRKRASIYFRPHGLIPDTFIKVSKYSHPDLPFSSFVFSGDTVWWWHFSFIQDFLKKWEKNIKEVTFDSIMLKRIHHTVFGDRVEVINNYDAISLFINPSNITCLKIKNPCPPTFGISLENFVSIKTLSLTSCSIFVPTEQNTTRIAPISVNLANISFIQNGKTLTHFHFNDLVDFSKALYINLKISDEDSTKATFDMSKQVFNLNQLCLHGVSLENWAQAKGYVLYFFLVDIPFLEKNQLKIKSLEVLDSYIDLAALPHAIEILQLSEDNNQIISSEPFHMPNLKYLKIDIVDIDNLAYFSNCSNLVDLIICDNKPESESAKFPLDYVPKSVKRMKMKFSPLEFTDDCIFELDHLILHDAYTDSLVTHCTTITSHIKAKVLVVVSDEFEDLDTSDIIRLVLNNQDSQTILFGSYSDLHEYTPFEESVLSKYVDKSNFYKFENNYGMSLTKEEFESYAELDDTISLFYR